VADYHKVALLVVRDGRMLLCRKKRDTSLLILPGGCFEPGETAEECLRRELQEELGPVSVAGLHFIGTYSDVAASDATKRVIVELYRGELTGEPHASSEIAELHWFGAGTTYRCSRPASGTTSCPICASAVFSSRTTLGICERRLAIRYSNGMSFRSVAAAFLMPVVLMAASSVHDFTLTSIDGKAVPLSSYKGKVVLLVNVASKCGYTPQYTGLQSLYTKYKDKGLVVVGVPANNFGGQEPGTNEEIKTFCSRNYNVTFPIMSKVSVKGDDKTPLYGYLTENTGGDVKWNFTKFLVDKNGKIVSRFESKVTPESPELTSAVEKALAQ
jgi:glutathione peroxidase